MKNINKAIGLIALAIVCCVVLLLTKNIEYFAATGIVGAIIVNVICDE